jgi:CRP-like cAMP-binding protein
MRDIRKSCANVLSQDFDYSALEEKSRVLQLPAGVVLYRKDDPAYDAYVLLSGEIVFLEQNIRVRPVSLFGEMGMFTEDSRRTMTAVTVTEAALLQTGYDDFLDLASHDPRFSFYLMHLMVKRMMRNIEAYRAPP